ncbi:hypothetical protein [Lyngbya confervoides]|uniref:Uncharacterized protein n=1 Tax=Lyngbya confervoides BDU141951 TaxID=1574623 RepID=A0ABD4T381_9CYAN|nr:hypothetical protein [Lyngbya confervoides]MCM1983133.1 hypothetical protein [Lyngbya confervoides BDU141951]
MRRSPYFLGLLITLNLLSLGEAAIAQSSRPCNPYRSGYEKAIAQGIIQRASLVSGPLEAFQYFQAALDKGDRLETAIRAAQYLVIISEGEGLARAEIARLDLEGLMVQRFKKPVAVAVPMLPVILPNNVFCPLPPSQP